MKGGNDIDELPWVDTKPFFEWLSDRINKKLERKIRYLWLFLIFFIIIINEFVVFLLLPVILYDMPLPLEWVIRKICITITYILVFWGSTYIYNSFKDTMNEIRIDNFLGADKKSFLNAITKERYVKIKYFVAIGFSILLLIMYLWALRQLMVNPDLAGSDPRTGAVSRGVIPIYITIIMAIIFYAIPIGEFVAIISGIMLTMHRFGNIISKIDKTNWDNCGGLKPIGNLLLKISSLYFIILALYMISQFGYVYEGRLYSLIYIPAFIGMWIFGFVIFILPQISIHKKLKGLKRNEIEKISERIRQLDEEPTDNKAGDMFIDIRIMRLRHELNDIKNMNEYPFDTAILKKLIWVSFTTPIIKLIEILVFNPDLTFPF